MGTKLQELGIDRLSLEDRLALVEEIWATICSEPGTFALSSEQRRELERRLEEDEHDPDAGMAWEEVKHAALQRLKG